MQREHRGSNTGKWEPRGSTGRGASGGRGRGWGRPGRGVWQWIEKNVALIYCISKYPKSSFCFLCFLSSNGWHEAGMDILSVHKIVFLFGTKLKRIQLQENTS
jgi:hypothetical protein